MVGQSRVVGALKNFAQSPRPAAFLLHGPTGTGKTTAAFALAAALGCIVEQGEFGGVWAIASGEQSADNVRDTARALHCVPMLGSGWRVLIVNECDKLSAAAEIIWLDLLENLPPRSVIVFTTNDPSKMSERFYDRCLALEFDADSARLDAPARELATRIMTAERGLAPLENEVAEIIRRSARAGKISFRRIVQNIEIHLMTECAA
jgi:DNA polymerase-3 subunit delta'